MAERSTAAVDVADNGGDEPLTAKADAATTDGTAQTKDKEGASSQSDASGRDGSEAVPASPDLHSGHKLARRYRLEECVTRLDGFSSWRAVDEKLRRAVGVHLLPADHPRARSVLAAARSSALLGDPRFVQVLDAVEEGDLVYVVHEWLPDATELTALLAAGPLEAHDAYQLVSQISQAMAAAHREGLAHLRLTPGAVLRSSTGQYRIRGLAVNAALRGITADQPLRTDTEAIGALLYAALTRRWPYESDAYGLSGLPKDLGLIPPDQVRAGVHRGLSELAMRALANDGATASRQEQPCTTPDELAKAVAAMPRVLPPEPVFAAPPEYQRTTYQQGTYGRPSARPTSATQPVIVAPPPPLQSRTGRALKWAVSALLIAALGLGSWQLAETVLDRDNDSGDPTPTRSTQGGSDDNNAVEPSKPVTIVGAQDYDPLGDGSEKPASTQNVHDGDASSYWNTDGYFSADFGRLKEGVGLVLDLGKVQQVGNVEVSFTGGSTSVELRTTEGSSIPQLPGGFTKVAKGTGTKVSLKPDKPAQARYLLVWLTQLPSDGGNYRGKITDIKVTS
ncbi:serine/threonine protein kinase [Streptomyces atroolivaceus]|uniref:Serine/threonine protein kinase n=1 Tax=Streptomyces atroolivaceus TaxID=66869 RepID=A0ABV9V893_STRAZ|nr:protein kinase family protein [Streptomyces atroolivaceus]